MGTEFRHFDSVPLALDHHYIKTKTSNNAKIIMKEWKILEQNLPDSIFVQVYETRIDLLRALIVGSPATPYHHCLFFFDILLPSDYPNHPPHVHYHSHGHRLNPNLYYNGKVCLSLINTWMGKREEKWSKGSTILQLLVSIQGLVLNSRPYFNEPAYEKHGGSERSTWLRASNRYNEDAFTLSCMTLLKLIKRPPQNFKSFVIEHCRQRGALLIEAIDNYEQGIVQVGELGMTLVEPLDSEIVASSRFKSNMQRMRCHLELVFAELEGKKKEKKKKGVFKRMAGFVKKMIWN